MSRHALVTARTERIPLRVTPDTKRTWKRAAERDRLTLTQWIERVVQAALAQQR